MEKQDTKIYSELHYFPNVSLFASLAANKTIYISLNQTKAKNSFLNRAHILGANGVEILTIPLAGGRNTKSTFEELSTANDLWRKKHQRAIVTSYAKSAYFEHYWPEIESIFEIKSNKLKDINLEIHKTIFRLLELKIEIIFTNEKIIPTPLMQKNTPNNIQQEIVFQPYFQHFGYKFPFMPHLSILDLLFNEGPETKAWLKNEFLNSSQQVNS